MNKAQERTLNRIRRKAMEELFLCSDKDNYEFKRWEVDDGEFFVSLCITTGRKGDEGTLAEYICRDRVQLFIGPRGGITYPVTKLLKNGKVRHGRRTLGSKSLLRVSIEQRA